MPGGTDKSYGIQVARLAGLPPAVVARAREILAGLERDELSRGGRPSLSGQPAASQAQAADGEAAGGRGRVPRVLLDDVRQLVREEVPARRARRVVSARAEVDVAARRERLGT